MTGFTEPTWSSPTHPMVVSLTEACQQTCGLRPRAIASLAATDARKWRARGVPAFTYGTTATNVAMPDEHTDLEEWGRVVRVHALSALDYLTEANAG